MNRLLVMTALIFLASCLPINAESSQVTSSAKALIKIDNKEASYTTLREGARLKKYQLTNPPLFTHQEDMSTWEAIDSKGTLFIQKTSHGHFIRYKKKVLPEPGAANTLISSACLIGLIWKSLYA